MQYPEGHGTSDILTPAEVAVRLGVAPSTVRRWINAGRLPAVRIGSRLRIREADLARVERAA